MSPQCVLAAASTLRRRRCTLPVAVAAAQATYLRVGGVGRWRSFAHIVVNEKSGVAIISDVGNKILCLGHYSLDKTNLYAMPDG